MRLCNRRSVDRYWDSGRQKRPQSEANLENSEGQREGLPHGDKKGFFRRLEEEHSDRRLTDCMVQPKGHTLTRGGQRYWKRTHTRLTKTRPFTQTGPHKHTKALYPSDQGFVITTQTPSRREDRLKSR